MMSTKNPTFIITPRLDQYNSAFEEVVFANLYTNLYKQKMEYLNGMPTTKSYV